MAPTTTPDPALAAAKKIAETRLDTAILPAGPPGFTHSGRMRIRALLVYFNRRPIVATCAIGCA
jgi:hypothetical protein